MSKTCVVVGSGPSALLAADELSAAGLKVSIYEKYPSLGRKLLIAGSSGLNVAYGGVEEESLFLSYPSGGEFVRGCLSIFPRSQWLQYLEKLGEEVYLGSSKRFFLRNHSAALLLQSWKNKLLQQGVEFFLEEEFLDFSISSKEKVTVIFSKQQKEADFLFLALGSPSWETKVPLWPERFAQKGIRVNPFQASNVGYSFMAPEKFFSENEGKPIKGIVLTTQKGHKQGELMITKYGIEGTPIYTLGEPGDAFLDLKPDLSQDKLLVRLQSARGNIAKRLEYGAKLSEGAIALALALTPEGEKISLADWSLRLKRFPLQLLQGRALTEAISASGGLALEELSEDLFLKKFPKVFCAGEMLDWDAPTGGFLLTACASMGFVAAQGIKKAASLKA